MVMQWNNLVLIGLSRLQNWTKTQEWSSKIRLKESSVSNRLVSKRMVSVRCTFITTFVCFAPVVSKALSNPTPTIDHNLNPWEVGFRAASRSSRPAFLENTATRNIIGAGDPQKIGANSVSNLFKAGTKAGTKPKTKENMLNSMVQTQKLQLHSTHISLHSTSP